MTPPSSDAGPTRRVLVPDRLAMEIHRFVLEDLAGPVQVAMFVTRGLADAGQREIALGVKVDPEESTADLEPAIGELFTLYFESARAGRTVDVGGRTVFAPESSPLLGRPDFRAIVYTTPDAVTRAVLNGDGLLAVPITLQELEISDQVGLSRLLSQLGRRVRFYPTPPWADRARPEVLTREFLDQSSLRGMPRLTLPRASAWIRLSGEATPISGPMDVPDFTFPSGMIQIHLGVPANSAALFREVFAQLPESLPLTVFTGIPPEISRCLTWNPGQKGVNAISDFDRRHDFRCAGNFVVFMPGQDGNRAGAVEDGFGLNLRTDEWRRIRKALSAGEELRIVDAAGAVVLDLAVIPEGRANGLG